MNSATAQIVGVATVAVPVSDQEAALAFYRDALGLAPVRDVPTPDGGRWLEVAPPGGGTSLALVPGDGGADTGIRLVSPDAPAAHAALAGRGVAVDELLAWPGVPPMFALRDPDGNRLVVLGAAGGLT